jgi:hypothetical protein
MSEQWIDIGESQRLRSGGLVVTVLELQPGRVTVVVEGDGPVPEPRVQLIEDGRITVDFEAAS